MSLEETWNMWQEAQTPELHTLTLRIMSIMANVNLSWVLYEAVNAHTGVPPHVIACLDYRETQFNHGEWLANGDPLFNSDGLSVKTAHVPVGLGPVKCWIDGAVLSLQHQGLDKIKNWDLLSALYVLEGWNGFGYANRGLNTPYLWSKTQFYTKGLFVADGEFDPKAVDYNFGCVPLLKQMKAQGRDLNEVQPSALV